MARKALVIPVGTHQPNGRLATVGETKIQTVGVNPVKYRSAVDCICDCGALTTISASKFLDEKTKSCGCHRRDHLTQIAVSRHLGPEYRRIPAHYGPALLTEQGLICAWPLCNEALTLPINVDHDRRHCDSRLCCAYCPRGLVHQRCNSEITVFERRRNLIVLPDSVITYLDYRRSNPLSSSGLTRADRLGGWAARRGIPSHPPSSVGGQV
jgi:hypothetical protein